jgi:hypothetical protein
VIADVVLVTEGSGDHDKRENVEITIRKTGFVAGVPVEGPGHPAKGVNTATKRKPPSRSRRRSTTKNYRGKKVDVTIKVKEVKKMEPAELNEDFFNRFGVEDEDDLKEMHP